MSITELAAAAGLSPRVVRFYVQRRLLRPPHGRGRGRHYDAGHLEELRKIRGLQEAGHTLDAIKRIQSGQAVEQPEPADNGRDRRRRAALSAGLWTRIVIADGVELHLDASKHSPEAEDLLLIQKTIKEILG